MNHPPFSETVTRSRTTVKAHKCKSRGRSMPKESRASQFVQDPNGTLIALVPTNKPGTSAAGKMTMQVLAAVAEFELDLIRERTASGLARAKSEGKQLGRPSALSPEQIQDIRARLADGSATVASLAREFSVGRATIQRARETVEGRAGD